MCVTKSSLSDSWCHGMSAVKVAMPLQQEVIQFPQEISPGARPPLQHIAVFHNASRLLLVYHFSQNFTNFFARTHNGLFVYIHGNYIVHV